MERDGRHLGDRLFDVSNVIFFSIVLIVVMYPIYFMFIASVSDPNSVNNGGVWLIPSHITWEGYVKIFQNASIWLGYRNSLFYAVVGVIVQVTLLLTGGYALSRRELNGGRMFMILIMVTMVFNGGLIPKYLIVRDMGMVNTFWALIIPNAISVYNLIIVRTFFRNSIPDALLEASVMDGCNDFRFFWRIVLPLSKPIIAVMIIFTTVTLWNSYFPALIYLQDQKMYPLQLVLRDILLIAQSEDIANLPPDQAMDAEKTAELIKYGVVIVASLPVMLLYPFLQKYFIHGVMIGSIKG